MTTQTLNRRKFLQASSAGLLVVGFSFSELAQAKSAPGLRDTKSVAKEQLDSWLQIDKNNRITVYVGNEPDLPTMGQLGSTGAISGLANFLPRTVRRMVKEHSGPNIAQDIQTIGRVLDTVRPYSLMPALKGIMASVSGDDTWLRVRAPLVALTPQAHAELQTAWKALNIDSAKA